MPIHTIKQMQKKLTDSVTIEDLYKKLYDESPDMLRTINIQGIILACNSAYSTHLGYSKREIVGKSIFDHTSPDSISEIRDSFETWTKNGIVKNKEIMLRRKDKSEFPVLLNANNLYDKNGTLVGSNTTLRDITEICKIRNEKERKEKQIIDQYLKIKKLSKQKDEFLSMITHELKTPIVPIKGYSDLLLEEKLGSLNVEQKRALKIIKSNVNFMQSTVSDLLDAQKIELGNFKLHTESYALDTIIIEVITEMKPFAASAGVEITKSLGSNIYSKCDKMRLKQVLINLMSNSVKYKHEDKGVIHITLFQGGGHAKIIVKDNGIGIRKEKLDKIFGKFYQMDTSLCRERGGVGLGLAICKGIIEAHGGKIFAKSEGTNKGTEIFIWLPMQIQTNNITTDPKDSVFEKICNNCNEQIFLKEGDVVYGDTWYHKECWYRD